MSQVLKTTLGIFFKCLIKSPRYLFKKFSAKQQEGAAMIDPSRLLSCGICHGADFEVFMHSSFTHLVRSEPLLEKVCSCLPKLLHSGLLYLQLLFPSQTLWCYLMGRKQELCCSRRDRAQNLMRGFIPVYQGKGKHTESLPG